VIRGTFLRVLTLLLFAGDAGAQPWERAVFEEVALEYRLAGTGEPVVLIHGGVFADGLEPLASSRVILKEHRVLTWHRVGYARSSSSAGHADILSQAAQLAQLMNRLELPRAHVVGHSSGGLIALQLALDHPARVHSLVLLEPALPVVGVANTGIPLALEAYRRGDREGAIERFMRSVAGANWRDGIDRELPLAFGQAVADAPAFFEQELPAVRAWQFDENDARRIRAPALAVMGGKSPAISASWPARQAFLLAHLPIAEAYVLQDATHMLAFHGADVLARRLRRFFADHPIAAGSR
jgi:pimeloyl-ACP methyl ester carboxylesterase